MTPEQRARALEALDRHRETIRETNLARINQGRYAARSYVVREDDWLAAVEWALTTQAATAGVRVVPEVLLKRLRDPRNQFLFDPQVSEHGWELLRDAADYIESGAAPPAPEGE